MSVMILKHAEEVLFLCLPVPEEGVHHAAVNDAEGQPHQHGHYVLGESIREAVFRHSHSAPCQRRAGITCQQFQRAAGGGGVKHHQHLQFTI